MTGLSTFVPDDCCAKPLGRALASGKLDAAESWSCPKCGCDWKPRMVGEIRHWEPHELIAVLRV